MVIAPDAVSARRDGSSSTCRLFSLPDAPKSGALGQTSLKDNSSFSCISVRWMIDAFCSKCKRVAFPVFRVIPEGAPALSTLVLVVIGELGVGTLCVISFGIARRDCDRGPK